MSQSYNKLKHSLRLHIFHEVEKSGEKSYVELRKEMLSLFDGLFDIALRDNLNRELLEIEDEIIKLK